MEYYVRGIGNRFSWRDVLKTLEARPEKAKGTAAAYPAVRHTTG